MGRRHLISEEAHLELNREPVRARMEEQQWYKQLGLKIGMNMLKGVHSGFHLKNSGT